MTDPSAGPAEAFFVSRTLKKGLKKGFASVGEYESVRRDRSFEGETALRGEDRRADGIIIENAARGMYLILTSLLEEFDMLAKLTAKNQLTLPKAVLSSYRGTEYFDVTEDNGRIVLTPVRLNRADAVRAKLADLGFTESDVAQAMAWARKRPRKAG